MKKWKQHRTKLMKQICNLRKTLELERVSQVLIAEVWPLRKNELDRPFDDRINDEQHYLSHLDDLLMMGEEDGNHVECLWIPI